MEMVRFNTIKSNVMLAIITHYFDCPLFSLSERSTFDLPI